SQSTQLMSAFGGKADIGQHDAQNGSRESAMAFHLEDRAAQEKIIGNFFLALIAAVVILILYKGVVLF
ncbi:MAG TPA: hypothetical protein VGU64_00375, partial [Terriglobales bacterium]|nr:hypothetical protein [Terriglobales bacterium]